MIFGRKIKMTEVLRSVSEEIYEQTKIRINKDIVD